MKRFILSIALLGIVFFNSYSSSKAQSIELIGGNLLNGAVTGSILGVATMGLQNSNDFAPLRIGLGAGIVGGTAIAIYDVSTLPKGQQFFISGLFNDGTNSSIIILLDTLYGATVGAALGSAIMLIGNQSLLDGLQYGSSIGAFAGFGLGLVDSFVLAQKNNDFVANQLSDKSSLFELEDGDRSLSFIQPDLFGFTEISENSLSYKMTPAVTLFSFQKMF
ncbi:hypothetical protein [Rhodohalobacter sp. 614A]|uniref:hypothetical protein n=1 Tax=Rhodohalobacter sp. 614A TaxID=2908649 RepID=UPI001F1EC1A0|nr:hypothetical protein [Rhodohalobacter sp. 614A]